MLGDFIAEQQGQITGTRVLPTDDGLHPVVEISFQATGQILDTPATDMGTYDSVVRPDGTIFGEGQGVTMATDGSGTVAWRGQGIGHFTESGGTSFRGAVYFETASDKFAHLNGVAGVYEYESDESGKVSYKTYEWK